MGELLGDYVLNIRVVEVETGKVICGDTAKGKTTDQIQVGVQALAGRVLAFLRGRP